MAKLTREEVLKLARLAKLEFTNEEVDEFRKDLSAILDYVEQLDKADTKGMLPTSQVTGLKNVMRKDEVVDYGVSAERLLQNVPQKNKDYIQVKRVLE